jgi:hypothetical protein
MVSPNYSQYDLAVMPWQVPAEIGLSLPLVAKGGGRTCSTVPTLLTAEALH